ncbi:MAG: serine/threonine protein kinase [Myxococcales bacterium]|nr:serine/threonine protein kinase [Myxococcales bacterium]
MTTPHAAVLGRADSERDYRAAILRMRQVLIAGVVLWSAAAPIDWIMSQRVHPGGALGAMIAMRLAVIAILLTTIVALRRQPRPAVTRLLWLAVFVGANAAQAGFQLALGHVSGPYAHGASVIVVASGLATPDHWRRGLRVLGPTALAYPVTIALAALASPRVAAQLGAEASGLSFLVDVTVLFMATALLLAAGHAFWALRRELFEARRLGGYQLKARIAVGGMGEVWRAWHGALKRDVAVKILRLDNADPAAAARFEREAAATAALTHPNTVRVLDYGVTDDGLSYFAMELLDGITLQELVTRDGPLPPPRAVYLIAQAAAALAEAHARGLIHRDVKPSNLLVTTAGGEPDVVKLIDFGIARDRGRGQATLTAADMVVGTPAYMAPEQATGGEVTPATDVYALAATCYFAITGHPIFDGATPEQMLAAQLRDQPARLASQAAVPDELDALVMRALAKEPAHRFADAAAFSAALAQTSLIGQWRPRRADAAAARALAPATDAAAAADATVPLPAQPPMP